MLCDRLRIPKGNDSVAPQYFDHDYESDISGVLWNACFAKIGTPISKVPDFEGAPTFDGHMSKHGLLVDEFIPFPSGAVIFSTFWGKRMP